MANDENDLAKKPNDELKAILDERGIKYSSKATKQELLELLGGD